MTPATLRDRNTGWLRPVDVGMIATRATPLPRDVTNPLGTFLRARRALVDPADVGLPAGAGRRVAGLRREEVATLAGISPDYYLRLERGRDRHPSAQVLEALGRVLRLDDPEVAYLAALAADAPRRRHPAPATPPAGALNLLETIGQPALIEDRYFDIVAANDAARTLSADLAPGGNRMRDLFLRPSVREFYPDWDRVAGCFVASLRHNIGPDVADPRFVELVGELSGGSAPFRELWARHQVREQEGAVLRMRHPRVGSLSLNGDRLAIGGAEELRLVVFHADAGSPDAAKLAALLDTAA